MEKKIGDKAAEQLKQTAVEIVQNCVDVYSEKFGEGDVGATGSGFVSLPYKGTKEQEIPYGTTGLIYGRVQSGKTNTTIATLAIAQENKFRCFIVLTSDNTWLGKQTADRFNNQLKGGPVVFNWEEWKKHPEDFVKNKLLHYIKDTGVVLVSTKNVRHLDNLLKVLKYAKANTVPCLIFDDEADNASLNTNEAKQAKDDKETVPDSKIFEKIGKIRKAVANHIYLQITATPQSLLLQNLDHPCKPAFCAALPEPGNSYMGGDLFFTESTAYCRTVNAEELEALKKQKGKINPGSNWDIPEGLRLALCCFFLGAVYKMQSEPDGIYSFLAHICYKQDNQENLEKIISGFVVELDKSLRGQLSATKEEQARKWLTEAYQELSKTALYLPSLDYLIEELKHELRRAIPKVINANNPDKKPNYTPGMNILIGGNRLGRGVTIEGLMVTYYGRDAKQKVMDTVHQHARMYGYREQLKDVTRLFLPQHILEAFRAIHEADEAMREAIGDDPNNIKIQPVWVGPKLKATRSCVLNPAEIDAFIPGSHIFPRAPLYKSSDVKAETEELNKLLNPYTENDKYYEVDIDFLIEIISHTHSHYVSGRKWEDKRVQKALQGMKANGIEKGRLNVRRGKTGEGLGLTRQEPSDWGGYGFATSTWITKAKNEYQNVPTVLMMYEKGEKYKGEKYKRWDNQPLYLPMLILPKSKFVFMFNYADESEEIEDDLEWDDSEEIDEQEWLHAAANNPVFAFLHDAEEDIYTLADGKPFND
ncbi:Z1 domain-containing protein [Ancylothrix sp. C2]|uniref:Z1 domain-containing protein n=1 Tax=Ancylothrix sp. D3o TaxID=2953691 RepID=UPI0021BB5E6B|nr:Z1 domain-containing protein [Ancylothrix sp. D3o]MCT7950787.1 Z1 domain-containing protein [Ancylothrix sp. D3o]